MKSAEQKVADLRLTLKIERQHFRDACQTIARLTMALQSIRDTAVATIDAPKASVLHIEAMPRIKEKANWALYPKLY